MHRTHISQADTGGTGAVHAIREAVHRRPAAWLRAGTDEGVQQEQGCFKRTAGKLIRPTKKKNSRKNKSYQRMEDLGEKLQADVKSVPPYCVSNGEKNCQFTVKGECTH